MRLTWHPYKYYPYERELAYREIAALFNDPSFEDASNGLEIDRDPDRRLVSRLTYFSGASNGRSTIQTLQCRLENAVQPTRKRQATRYSVHGMHEYKGKFNPQVVRAVLNIFKIGRDQMVLDPFCGSGTTLVECSHIGVKSYGVDLNPFAVFLANAKLLALSTPAGTLKTVLERITVALEKVSHKEMVVEEDLRSQYLRSWFDFEILCCIEKLRTCIEGAAEDIAPVFLAIASNLLRDYSRQDPKDLRIRRRKSPLPNKSIFSVFLARCRECVEHVEVTQQIIGTDVPRGRATLSDSSISGLDEMYDAGITSPPYAMALPYIDTQRLSLVWLGLVEPKGIAELGSELIGSREFRGHTRNALVTAMHENGGGLPVAQADFCTRLQMQIGEGDGFRRQAVPVLLYRYFASMLRSFKAIRKNMVPKAPFALIVGHNHTVLGGVRHEINTPEHLTSLALESGWTLEEVVPLQTYQRYGYHANNAINAESLIVLRNT